MACDDDQASFCCLPKYSFTEVQVTNANRCSAMVLHGMRIIRNKTQTHQRKIQHVDFQATHLFRSREWMPNGNS